MGVAVLSSEVGVVGLPGAGEAGGFEEGVEAAPPSRGAADQPAAQKVSDGSEEAADGAQEVS